MPLYEYQCDACGARFELIRKFSDPPVTTCPTCGQERVQKLVSSPAFQFKGSGWYVTDYARKSGDSASAGKPASKPEGKSNGEAASTSASDTSDKADKPASTPASTKD